MKLKVCGMVHPQNIQELVNEVNPDWMGMIFYPPSPRYVGTSGEIASAARSLDKVGVFVNEPLSSVLEKVALFGLKVLQLHGNESVEEVRLLKEKSGLEIFKVFKIGNKIDWELLRPYLPWVDYFLFDTYTEYHGGSGKTFDWSLLKNYPYEKPFILSGGIGIEEVQAILDLKKQMPQLAGLDINSRFEIAPGLKDIPKIKAFKKQLMV
ncbi:phosphoribosylanthranilate isomerase [Cecembia lonarensis]|nr:phosphoribosylanthranilate isomerase [Cecembia lonarensis]